MTRFLPCLLLAGCAGPAVVLHETGTRGYVLEVTSATLSEQPGGLMRVDVTALPTGTSTEGGTRVELLLEGKCGAFMPASKVQFSRVLPPGPAAGRAVASYVFLSCDDGPAIFGKLWGTSSFHDPTREEHFVLVLDTPVRLTRAQR